MEGGLLSPSFQGSGYGRVSCEPEPALQKVTARCRGEDIVQEPTEDTQCAFKQTAGAPQEEGGSGCKEPRKEHLRSGYCQTWRARTAPVQ